MLQQLPAIATLATPVATRGSGRVVPKLYLTSDAAKLPYNQTLRHVCEAVHKTENLKMDLDVVVAWSDIAGKSRLVVFNGLLRESGYSDWVIVEAPIRVTPDVF